LGGVTASDSEAVCLTTSEIASPAAGNDIFIFGVVLLSLFGFSETILESEWEQNFLVDG
jgi:hypothetical protein